MDAFISHSSVNGEAARDLERDLEAGGLSVWLDSSEMRTGSLLRGALRDAIGDAGAFVLVWSEAAARSRWVNSEWITAVLLERPILPYALDATELPQCLGSATFARRGEIAQLARSIRQAAGTTTDLSPLMRYEAPELTQAIAELHGLQAQVTDAGDDATRREAQQAADEVLARARARWPLDPMVLNLTGYHLKNAYMTEHWDAIQAGRAPRDDRLDEAESLFFEVLWLDPLDPSALNGLGSILTYQREPRAAEFFILAALRLAGSYPEAEHDLALARRFITTPR